MGGIFKGKWHGKLSPEDRDKVAVLYRDGASLKSLSVAFGIGVKSVKSLLNVRGVKLRPYVPQVRERKYRKSDKPVHERWATKQVELAIRRGDIVRPSTCSSCNVEDRVHGHHDDYNRPLDIRWLCPKCHYDWHSKNIPIPSV